MAVQIEKYITLVLLLAQCYLGTVLGTNDIQNQIHPKTGTIVFVHGFMRSSKNMSVLVYSFKREGWRVINWSYPSRNNFIEGHADDLVNKLSEISQQHPHKPISFVTHSMGGLIVRAALNHPDCPDEAKMGRAVLIAPPNRGSIFARKLYNYQVVRGVLGEKSGRQLMTAPLDDFDRFGNFPDHMPVLIISGTAGFNPMIPDVNDGKVGLMETCLKTPHFHKTCFAGHSWICHTPNVIKKAKNFLSSPQLPTARIISLRISQTPEQIPS